MDFFHNATADLHIGVKAAMGIWAAWSVIKLFLNMFGVSFKKKKEHKNVEA